MKIVVIDNLGKEHIFNEDEDTERSIDVRPLDNNGVEINNAVQVYSRFYENGKLSVELTSTFLNPSVVNVFKFIKGKN